MTGTFPEAVSDAVELCVYLDHIIQSAMLIKQAVHLDAGLYARVVFSMWGLPVQQAEQCQI